MELKKISLRKYCRERTTLSPDIPLSKEIFTIEDFKSKGFVDKLINNFHKSKIQKPIEPSTKELLSLINETNQTFDMIKERLDSLREIFIKQMIALCTNDNLGEKLETVVKEMKQCHRNILRCDWNPLLIEEFVKLFDQYKYVSLSPNPFPYKERVAKVSKTLESISKGVDSIINKYSKIATFEDLMYFPIEGELKEKAQYEEKEITKLKDRKEAYNEGLVFKWKKEKNFFFITQQKHSFENKQIYEILNLKNGKTVFSMSAMEATHRARGKVFGYAENINSIILQDSRRYTLNFYRLTAKGMKKFTSIPIGISTSNSITTLLGFPEKIAFEYIDSYHVIVIAYDSYFKFVNIFTRKILIEHTYDEKICDIKYLRDLNFFIVLLGSGKIEIFSLLSGASLLHLKHTIKADVTDIPVKLFSAGNMFLIHESAECQQPRDETKTFHLFEINRTEVKNYRVILSFDLRVPNVTILPDQKRVKICYYPTYSEVRVYNYSLTQEKPEEEEKGLIMWGNENTLVYLRNDTIILKTKMKNAYNSNNCDGL